MCAHSPRTCCRFILSKSGIQPGGCTGAGKSFDVVGEASQGSITLCHLCDQPFFEILLSPASSISPGIPPPTRTTVRVEGTRRAEPSSRVWSNKNPKRKKRATRAADSGLNRWMAHPMRYIPQNNLITPGGPLPLHRGQITTNPTSDIRIQGELRLIDGNRQACPVHASHLPCYCSGVRWFFPTHPLPHTFFLLRSA